MAVTGPSIDYVEDDPSSGSTTTSTSTTEDSVVMSDVKNVILNGSSVNEWDPVNPDTNTEMFKWRKPLSVTIPPCPAYIDQINVTRSNIISNCQPTSKYPSTFFTTFSEGNIGTALYGETLTLDLVPSSDNLYLPEYYFEGYKDTITFNNMKLEGTCEQEGPFTTCYIDIYVDSPNNNSCSVLNIDNATTYTHGFNITTNGRDLIFIGDIIEGGGEKVIASASPSGTYEFYGWYTDTGDRLYDNQFAYYSSTDMETIGFIAKFVSPTDNTPTRIINVQSPVSVIVFGAQALYDLNLTTGTGVKSVTITRTSSYYVAAGGVIQPGQSVLFEGDVISVSAEPLEGYLLNSFTSSYTCQR